MMRPCCRLLLCAIFSWLPMTARAVEAPPPSAAAPQSAAVSTVPAATPAVPIANTPLNSAPAILACFDDVEMGAMVLYRVGPPPTPGVVSREQYKIRYELLRLTDHDATLARTTLSSADRELAREVLTVRRYLRLEREPAPANAPPESATVCSVAGQALNCRLLRATRLENGRPRQLEWALSSRVPLTGLVYEKIDGHCQLELLAFSRGGEDTARALASAAAQAARDAQIRPSADAPARPAPPPQPLLPGTVIVDPRTGTIVTVPELEEPVLPEGDFPLQDSPALPPTSHTPSPPSAPSSSSPPSTQPAPSPPPPSDSVPAEPE